MKYCILTPRFPFPENGGDVLRINNVARYLKAQGHSLCLVSFAPSKVNLSEATKLYDSVYYVPLHKAQSYFFSVLYWLLGKPMQCGYYHSKAFLRLLKQVIEKEHPDRFVAHLLRMTPYLEQLGLQAQSIVEMTDTLSKTYALAAESQNKGWMKLVYRMEQSRIRRYEQWVAKTFPRVVLVSQKDVDYLQALSPSVQSLVCCPNGVECKPELSTDYNPLKICFVGNMRTLQNQDAVFYFVKHVLPLILQEQPKTMLYIVGAEPPAAIRALASEHIVITGFVEDVQMAIQDACVMVAPVFVAAGIQNKVLVAMGCGVPVILSSLIAQSIPEIEDGTNAILADKPQDIANAVLDIMTDPIRRNTIGRAGYKMVSLSYSWTKKLEGYVLA